MKDRTHPQPAIWPKSHSLPWPWPAIAVLVALAPVLLSGCVDSSGAQGSTGLDIAAPEAPGERANAVRIVVLMTVLSLAPAVLMLLTSFTRIIIVLSFVRTAIGLQQLPPNQVFIGLALFLTFFVMTPVWDSVSKEALDPYVAGQISEEVAAERAMVPLRQFMVKQTREQDIELFLSLARIDQVNGIEDVPNHVLVPAFVISELKTGFQMGFLVFIPFLIIDFVVSSVLMSMGMMMLPPVVVSLPFKVLLFVLIDGWHLVVRSLLVSFG